MNPERAHDEPSEVAAEDGLVIVDGPNGVAVTLTPGDAVETSYRLLDGGLEAQGQIVRRGAPSEQSGDGEAD
ncbi:MAG: hypothetical protein JO276_12330 [Sphingomonadaceae bacterium]|nr:hypothetical protein [Sphingomonadaceae bacterium]